MSSFFLLTHAFTSLHCRLAVYTLTMRAALVTTLSTGRLLGVRTPVTHAHTVRCLTCVGCISGASLSLSLSLPGKLGWRARSRHQKKAARCECVPGETRKSDPHCGGPDIVFASNPSTVFFDRVGAITFLEAFFLPCARMERTQRRVCSREACGVLLLRNEETRPYQWVGPQLFGSRLRVGKEGNQELAKMDRRWEAICEARVDRSSSEPSCLQ